MRQWVRSVGAVVALVLLLVGVPLLLVRVAGYPLPQHRLDVAHMRQMVRQGDVPAEFVIKAIAVVVWFAWIQLAWAVLWELFVNLPRAGTGRQRRAPFVPRLMSMGVARLVAAVASAGIVGSAAMPAAAAPVGATPVVLTATPAVAVPGTGTDAAATTAARTNADLRWRVDQRDTLWDIAERALGDGTRVGELLDLNPQLGSPRGLRAGQQLRLPAGAFVPIEHRVGAPAPITEQTAGPSTAAEAVPSEDGPAVPAIEAVPAAAKAFRRDAAPATPTTHHVVVEGDTLWDILEQTYGTVDADLVWTIAKVNAIADPDLIHVGDVIRLPGAIPGALPRPQVRADAEDLLEALPASTAAAPATPAPPPTLSPPPADFDDVPARPETPAATSTPTTTTTTTTVPMSPGGPGDERPGDLRRPAPTSAPAPIGLGEAGLISAGVVALVTARRRARLRAARSLVRLPERTERIVDTERSLRRVGANERIVRVDVAIRAAAAEVVDTEARLAVVQAGPDGVVTVTFTGPVELPAPWIGSRQRWAIPGSTPIELLAERARRVGAPCVALVQLGVDPTGADVLVDLEAAGTLTVGDASGAGDDVVRAIAAGLATSPFAEPATLIGVGVPTTAFLGRPDAIEVSSAAALRDELDSLVGAVPPGRTTFALRARHTGGEAWEPGIVLVAAAAATAEIVEAVGEIQDGSTAVAAVIASKAGSGPSWSLLPGDGEWELQPFGLSIRPVGLTVEDLDDVVELVADAEAPLVPVDDPFAPEAVEGADASASLLRPLPPESGIDSPPGSVPERWSLLVRVLGPVEVVDREFRAASFGRAKPLELVSWLVLNREQPKRRAARTALWEIDVRDATFANVVSEARRVLRALVSPPAGEEWVGRTTTDRLPLHRGVICDVEVVQAALQRARVQPPEQAIATLRPAVELIRGMPFDGAGYLWPDADGVTSNLIMLSTAAAAELAGHYLSLGDVDGVFWATGRGLKALPGHEELISLRMRAFHRSGDLAGVRAEWDSYERVLRADQFSTGEPARKLVELRRELLSS